MRLSSRLFLGLFLLIASCVVHAVDYRAEWGAPVQRLDGVALPLAEIGGFEIRYKKASDTTFKSVVIANNAAVSYNLVGLDAAQYQVSIAAYDTNGLYSDFIAFAPALIARPGAPTLFKVKQNVIDVVAACLAAGPNCKVAVQGEWQ